MYIGLIIDEMSIMKPVVHENDQRKSTLIHCLRGSESVANVFDEM